MSAVVDFVLQWCLPCAHAVLNKTECCQDVLHSLVAWFTLSNLQAYTKSKISTSDEIVLSTRQKVLTSVPREVTAVIPLPHVTMTFKSKLQSFFSFRRLPFFGRGAAQSRYDHPLHGADDEWAGSQSKKGDILLMDFAPLLSAPRDLDTAEHMSLLRRSVYDDDAAEMDDVVEFGMTYLRTGSRRWSVRCDTEIDEDGDELEAVEWFASAKGF